MFAPEVGRADDNAVSKGFLARSGEKAVYVSFLQAVVFCIELALDGVVCTRAASLCYKVNAGVLFPTLAVLPNLRMSTRRCIDRSKWLRCAGSKQSALQNKYLFHVLFVILDGRL